MNSVIVMTQTSNYSQDGLSIIHKPLIKIEPLSFNLALPTTDRTSSYCRHR